VSQGLLDGVYMENDWVGSGALEGLSFEELLITLKLCASSLLGEN